MAYNSNHKKENKTMTDKTAEAVRNGSNQTAQELFELVNAYEITMLSIQDKNNKTMTEMDVNHFDSHKTELIFEQLNADTKCLINQSDILSAESTWIEEEDMIHIKCCLSDGGYMNLVIFHASNGLKITTSKDYYEISLYELNQLLEKTSGDNPEYSCSVVKVKNKSGFNMRMIYPKQTFIDMENDDTNGQLCIEDDVNFLKVDVMDDRCNQFYQKDNAESAEIVIRPYSEPFMEIRMFFDKLS